MEYIPREKDGTPIWERLKKHPCINRSEVISLSNLAKENGCRISIKVGDFGVLYDGEHFSSDVFDPCVYFMQAGPFIKIGRSKDPYIRAKEISTGTPYPIEIIGGFVGGNRLEKDLHRHFSEYRSHGEWFRCEGRLAEFVGIHFTRKNPPKPAQL